MARFKDLCLDTDNQQVSVAFWAAVLGLDHDPRPWGAPQPLRAQRSTQTQGSPDPRRTLWVNLVPEPKDHKARVHLDVHCGGVGEVTAHGAAIVDESHDWTVLRAPDGLELCAFVRDDVPANALYELVVDCAEPERLARWWAERLGLEVGSDDDVPWWWVEGDGLPFDGIVFVPVPEPKRGKNRVHWDVTGTVEEFTRAGAAVVETHDGGDWTVLADPEGNEFCVFPDPDTDESRESKES
ncbi:VOC family protein [Mariniluteicoccus flavus]